MAQERNNAAEGGPRTRHESGAYEVARITVTQTTTMTLDLERRVRGPGVRKSLPPEVLELEPTPSGRWQLRRTGT